jgi:hypothetical protein
MGKKGENYTVSLKGREKWKKKEEDTVKGKAEKKFKINLLNQEFSNSNISKKGQINEKNTNNNDNEGNKIKGKTTDNRYKNTKETLRDQTTLGNKQKGEFANRKYNLLINKDQKNKFEVAWYGLNRLSSNKVLRNNTTTKGKDQIIVSGKRLDLAQWLKGRINEKKYHRYQQTINQKQNYLKNKYIKEIKEVKEKQQAQHIQQKIVSRQEKFKKFRNSIYDKELFEGWLQEIILHDNKYQSSSSNTITTKNYYNGLKDIKDNINMTEMTEFDSKMTYSDREDDGNNKIMETTDLSSIKKTKKN